MYYSHHGLHLKTIYHYNHDKRLRSQESHTFTMYDDMREHCPNELCENAVCLTVPQSTENTINNNHQKRDVGCLKTRHNLSTCTK